MSALPGSGGSPLGRLARPVLLAAFAMTVLGLLGGAAGRVVRTLAAQRQEADFRAALAGTTGENPASRAEALAQMRQTLPESPLLRLELAFSYLALARESETPESYRRAARREADVALRLVEREQGADAFERLDSPSVRLFLLRLADIYAEAGRDRDAARYYGRLLAREERLPALDRATLWNNAAFLFARSEDPRVADPARAHALSARAVKSAPAASSAPDFLDTLAYTYYAMGKHRQAVRIEADALARGERENLFVYLRHYDRFARAADGERGSATDADAD